MTNKYFIVHDKKKVIWGYGKSKEEARRVAINWAKRWGEKNTELHPAIPCSKRMWDWISSHGIDDSAEWSVFNGVAELEIHLEEDADKQSVAKIETNDVFLIPIKEFAGMEIGQQNTILFKALKELKAAINKDAVAPFVSQQE